MSADRTGREVLEAFRDGTLPPPPLTRLVGFRIEEVGDGRATFLLEPRAELENGAGLVHGGVAAAMLDTALGAAVQTRLPAGARSATLNLNVGYHRAVTLASGTISAVGRATRIGRRVAFAEGDLVDGDGRTCATATATFSISGLEAPGS